MSNPNTPNQPQPKIIVGPKSSTDRVTLMQAAVPSQDRIRERAYELYESRAAANPANTNRTGSAPSRRSSNGVNRPHPLPKVHLPEGWRDSHGLLNLQGSGESSRIHAK